MTGTLEYQKGDKRALPDFNVFFRYYATYPLLQRLHLVSHSDAPLGPDRRSDNRTNGMQQTAKEVYQARTFI